MTGKKKARQWRAAALALAMLTLAGCGASPAPGPDTGGDITVLAAASLTGSFTELADQFMAEHPESKISLSFGSSSALALTISEGSPADILATADQKSMDVALNGFPSLDSEPFAGNELVIAVAKGNPQNVVGLEQLAGSKLLISRCAAEVPCGRLTNAALKAGDLSLEAVTEGSDVKATLAPLVTGQVDAALVYRTDALASSDVELVEIEGPLAQSTQYPMAVLSEAQLAQEFYEFIVSPKGLEVLEKHGFTQAEPNE